MADARMIHDLEQMGGALSDLAPVLRTFYERLRAADFDDDQALQLTGTLLETIYRDAVASVRDDVDRLDGPP